MTMLKCFKCGNEWQIECADCVASVVCPKCGSVNEIPEKEPETEGDWLQCIAPEGFEWSLPAGKIGNPVVGYKYVPADGGKPMTKEAFTEKYGVDPEVALEYMRKNRQVKK